MAGHDARRPPPRKTPEVIGRTVALAILPPLFRDALTIALRAQDIAVVHVDDASPMPTEDIELAIICSSLEVSIDADTVIKMPPEGDDRAWLLRRGEPVRQVPIPDLEAVLRMVGEQSAGASSGDGPAEEKTLGPRPA